MNFFHLSSVIRLEDYFQMVIISISAVRTTQFADVNAVGRVVGLGGVKNSASLETERWQRDLMKKI